VVVVSRALRAHRLVVVTAVVTLVLLGAGAVVLTETGAQDRSTNAGVLGPGRVTVRLDVDHSRFEAPPLRVRPHTEVRFVVVNHDPIGHELIVGGPEVQARHAGGHEAYHPPVPGEVSVSADARASTSYVFHTPGPVEYACHLPGHYEYGMHGTIEVVADGRVR
jgi:uncharacterized cupredoxin-like copper-binding protein